MMSGWGIKKTTFNCSGGGRRVVTEVGRRTSRGPRVGRFLGSCAVGNLWIPLHFSHEPNGFESRNFRPELFLSQ